MATSQYILGRKKYSRPQAILWSENAGTLSNGFYVPNGYEVGANAPEGTDPDLLDQFIILSDDNREPLDFKPLRLENRERTINGRMRSYHIADKLTMSLSWQNLPSRSYALVPEFNTTAGSATIGKSPNFKSNSAEYTTDGGAGGAELLDWYENHKGPFWVFLAYDKYTNFGNDNNAYAHLQQYNEVVEMYISEFSYSVSKRGGSNFDFWNVSVTLEEV